MKADLVVKNGHVVTPQQTFEGGVAISGGTIVAVGASDSLPDGTQVIDVKGQHILPGLIDAHVHFRDPGLTHKEDFATGSTAAVCGGITTIVDMPNVIPPTENAEQVAAKKKIAESKSLCDFAVLGVIHQTNVNDILPMAKAGAIGYKIFFGETIGNLPFPDDGMCMEVFPAITESKIPLCTHAENRQIQHYYTNKMKAEGKADPIYWEDTRPWICEAEAVNHILFLAESFGTKLHIVHCSSKQAAQIVKDAKARGLRVTAETGPHYLLREPKDMAEVGPLLKMNEPAGAQQGPWRGALAWAERGLHRHDRHRPLAAHARGEGLRHQRQDGQERDLGLHLRLLRRRDQRAADAHAGECRPHDAQPIRQGGEREPRPRLADVSEEGFAQCRLGRRSDHHRYEQGSDHRSEEAAFEERADAVGRLESERRADLHHRSRQCADARRRAGRQGRRPDADACDLLVSAG
jgi:hypothetical protein